MTTVAQPAVATAGTAPGGPLPSRRLLVGLSIIYLVSFGALMATGSDRSAYDNPEKLISGFNVGDVMIQVMTYSSIVVAGVLIFYGAALRTVLAAQTRRWTGDVALIGFLTMAWTLASWAVTALALHHAVHIGDAQIVQTINILDTTNFPPAMLGLMCSMIGVGLTALKGSTLPKWLAVASVVIGAMAPLGPGGFVPFMLFPIWLIVVAAMVRLSD